MLESRSLRQACSQDQISNFAQEMEERNTSGRLLNKDSTTPFLSTGVTETNENYQNNSSPCHMQLQTLDWFTLITAVVGIAGNVVVLWLLGFRIRRSAVSVYILNLAAADSITLCLSITFIITIQVTSYPFKNYLFFIVFTTVITCSYITGLSMLSAISMERCLSVLWPIWYRSHQPKHTSVVLCGLLWTIAIMLSILHGWHCVIKYIQMEYSCFVTLGCIIATYLIILSMILSGSSLALVVRTFCGSHRIRMTRLCVTILLTVLVFLFCGLPLGIHYFLIYRFRLPVSDLPCYFDSLSVFLSCVNSSANPIIYFFIGSFRQHKRQSLKLVLQRALQDTPERDDTGSSFLRETLEMSKSRVEQGLDIRGGSGVSPA